MKEFFDDYRTSCNYIDLVKAYEGFFKERPTKEGKDFLENVVCIHPIVSRQVAAVALATARSL